MTADTPVGIVGLGLMGVAVPEAYGGSGGDTVGYVLAVEELARACASTAWNWVNFAAHHMMLGMFPREVQDEVWNKSRDAMSAGSRHNTAAPFAVSFRLDLPASAGLKALKKLRTRIAEAVATLEIRYM